MIQLLLLLFLRSILVRVFVVLTIIKTGPRYPTVTRLMTVRYRCTIPTSEVVCRIGSDVICINVVHNRRIVPAFNRFYSDILDYLLPNLDRSVPAFTGRESYHVAEDWIESVDGFSTINSELFRYRLQYVRANVVSTVRNWYLSENFPNWSDLLTKFFQAFVQQIQ